MAIFDSVLGSAGIGILLFLVSHLLIWRLRPSNSPRVLTLGLLAGAGMIAAVGLNLWQSGVRVVELSAIVWIHLFFVIAYLFVYAGIARSVSVTLLSRLLECEDRSLDFVTLVDEYRRSSRFEDRMQLMHQSGLVQLSVDDAILTPTGELLARFAARLGKILGEGLEG